jgi:hypothetical protein
VKNFTRYLIYIAATNSILCGLAQIYFDFHLSSDQFLNPSSDREILMSLRGKRVFVDEETRFWFDFTLHSFLISFIALIFLDIYRRKSKNSG